MARFPHPAAEREAARIAKDLAGSHFRFHPVPYDAGLAYIKAGQVVVKTQPHGCPANGTMGMCYVACADTGRFLGMVCESSLVAA